MTVKFVNTIVFVKDIELSKRFYVDIVGLNIINDYETIVFFDNHFVIHNSQSIINTIFKSKQSYSEHNQGQRNILVYLESDNLKETYNKIKDSGAKIIHEIEEQAWGQKVFRFYDPDDHMIEIGEPFRVDF